MSYAELIRKLETLPQEKRFEVFEFVEFLVMRWGKADQNRSSSTIISRGDAVFLGYSMEQSPLGREDEQFDHLPQNSSQTGPLAALRARVPGKQGNIQPFDRDSLYDRESLY